MRIRCLIPAIGVFACCGLPVQAQPFQRMISNDGLSQWMTDSGEPVSDRWVVEPGAILHLKGKGGHIVTRREYRNFELWFDWKIGDKGNSGIKYRVKKYGNRSLGCEYQILDDTNYPNSGPLNRTASLYDIVPVRSDASPPRQNDWNKGKIRVQGTHIQHWLNGELTIDAQTGTSDWDNAIAASKFSDQAGFGEHECGRIMLTDHNHDVWFRNIYIRELP